jgi:hypothetical protein
MLELQVTMYRGSVMTAENLEDMHISAPAVGHYVRAVEKQLKKVLMQHNELGWKATFLHLLPLNRVALQHFLHFIYSLLM